MPFVIVEIILEVDYSLTKLKIIKIGFFKKLDVLANKQKVEVVSNTLMQLVLSFMQSTSKLKKGGELWYVETNVKVTVRV